MNERPAIPSELRRRILVEAGHRCAIPTCRHIDVDIHHIEPWESCQRHEYENLIALCPNCHRRADNDEIDRKSLRIYKANLRYVHDRFSPFEVDFLFQIAQEQNLKWPEALSLLIKRLLDAKLIAETGPRPFPSYQGVGGFNFRPMTLELTETGREFLEALSRRNFEV